MLNEIRVYAVELDQRSTPNNQMGGDMHKLKTFKTTKAALKFGLKESFKTTIMGEQLHEIWIEKLEDDEVTEQWAYKNGKLTFHTIPA